MSRVTIAINPETKLRLMRHMVYGDSFDSAINAILDKLEQPSTPNTKIEEE